MIKTNWMMANVVNMAVAAEILKRDGFILPSPRCFGKPVKSFNLDLRPKAKIPQWKLVLNTLKGLIL